MKIIRVATALALAIGLGACAQVGDVTRASPLMPLMGSTGEAPAAMALSRDYKIVAVDVAVPTTLVVSEANSYKPRGDIVWREDLPGDRYAQVDKLVTDAITAAVSDIDGKRKVTLAFVVTRFHALTEKARFSAPSGLGTHEVYMTMAVLDAATGDVIEPARPVGFTIEAHTSDDAIADMARGISQRSRISEALAVMVRRELGIAAG
jgi:hypothetical protein